jgi:formylglycine-generating enzyme required for sulfatase activity
MSLEPGHYDILVERSGYRTARQWVTIRDRDVVVEMALDGVAPKRPAPPRHPKSVTNSLGMKFVLLRAGQFQMGSASGGNDEQPVHRVALTQPFYLGTTEVTQSQWQSVMGSNPSQYKGANRPVENVSWEDVQSFIKQLNRREQGVTYRLPTEAEWEYGARAGATTAYSFGDAAEQLDEYAWYWENSDKQTHPVGQKRANDWGLYDMYGNVWEWVQDWYEGNYYQRSPEQDPAGPPSGSNRVVRGGSWYDGARYCRSAYRVDGYPGARDSHVGFRLLRVVQ